VIRRLGASLAVLSILVSTTVVAPAATLAACDPFTTPPTYDQGVRTSNQVIGFTLGSQEASVAQSNAYLEAVDADSDRVVHDVAAVSVGGLPIDYAIVGTPGRVTATGLSEIRDSVTVLRDPLAGDEAVNDALAATPAVLWVSANVHGNEESGADAALQVLYELANRSDCVVTNILSQAIVVILPIQNPDGREAGTRRNLYGFDMNRDWFARTQPETDGKLQVLRQYPPMLYIDAHEFSLPNYFFPPNADPEYHETPDAAHDWINGLYSPAIAAQFDREKIKYFHGAPYDFFATVFGDTVPTVGFHAAGMTFEKHSADAISVREHEHFTSMWASIAAGAAARSSVLTGWHDSYVEAYDEGLAGSLEPNAVFEPKHDLYQPVPDVTVRHYFLRNDPNRAAELQLLVRRLQRMDVTVNTLTEPLELTSFHPYGDPSEPTTLPVGTYWIPMAQAQKHWVQAMLNEDSWIPFDVTYDVTAWSNPLLMNLDGGWTGQEVDPVVSPTHPAYVFQVEGQERRAAEPTPHLDLAEDEERPDQGEADMGGEVDLDLVQPEEAGEADAEQQVEPEEGGAADEHPERHRRRLAGRRVGGRAELVEQLEKRPGEAEARGARLPGVPGDSREQGAQAPTPPRPRKGWGSSRARRCRRAPAAGPRGRPACRPASAPRSGRRGGGGRRRE